MKVRTAFVVSLLFASLLGVVPAGMAAATSPPGIPGAPAAVGMEGGVGLRWAAPGGTGSPSLTGYRVEVNDGSGWSTARAELGADTVAGGLFSTCAVTEEGAVKCWGHNNFGQLGLGDTTDRGDDLGEMGDALPVVDLGSGRTAVAITSGGGWHTCALLDDGTVKCWGSGALGLGDSSDRGGAPGQMGDALPVVDLGTGRTAVAISAGSDHVCALLDGGSVKCWGINNFGQLGLGDTANRGSAPGQMGDDLPEVALGTGRTAVAIEAGPSNACALLDDGAVKCWGRNLSGALGLGDTANRGDGPGEMGDNLPTVSLGTGRTAVGLTNSGHVCALLDNDSVKCWGTNDSGQLGLGDTAARGDGPGEMGDALPVLHFGSGRIAVALRAGGSHSCALLDDDSVKCWGGNLFGDLGLGDTAKRGDGPGEMGDSLPAVDLGGRVPVTLTGNSRTCVVSSDAALRCWGNNGGGALGLGDDEARGDQPREMGRLPAVALGSGRPRGAVAVAVGNYHSCAVLDDGAATCWGSNTSGRLGLGEGQGTDPETYRNTTDRGDDPGEMGSVPRVALGTGRTATALAAGYGSTCALLDDGSVKCWGYNEHGQLGLGDTGNKGDDGGEMGDDLPAVDLGAGRTAVAIGAGDSHACAVLDDGSVKCWGYNEHGQLGLGDTANRGDGPGEMGDDLPAVDLGAGRTAVAITAGDFHTCAVLDDASVKCWGYNGVGQLGIGNPYHRGDGPGEMGDNLPPVSLGTARTATGVVGGAHHTCAALDDASLKCWGSNSAGQLGLGDVIDRGDNPGEMGDDLPAIDLGTARAADSVTLGGNYSCAVLDDASVKCWGGVEGFSSQIHGDEPGEMGDNLATIALGAGRTTTAISAAFRHTCAVLDDATVKCWGLGVNGQLGNGALWQTGNDLSVAVLDDPQGVAPARAAVVRLELGTYQFRVVAVGSGGESAPSAASAPVTVVTIPGAPSTPTVTAGQSEIALNWSAPAFDGGSAITDYRVSVFNATGGAAAGVTGPTSRLVGSPTTATTFTGLFNGIAYTFRVAAVNPAGTGTDSALSSTVTPRTSPSAPAAPTGTPGNGQASLTWTAPFNNGSAITDYQVSVFASGGGPATGVTGPTARLVGSATTAFTFTGLANGTAYTFKVAAVNAIGTGTPSALSAVINAGTPVGPIALTATSAPTALGATTGSLIVSFIPGADNGSAVISYTATCTSSNAGVTTTATGAASPLTVTGATTAKTYTCTVKATNARGAGSASAASLAVIVGSPAAPTAVKAVATAATTTIGSLVVSFTPGADNGRPIYSYTATCTSSNAGVTRTATGGASPLTVTGGSTAKTYTCTVKATNDRGASLASAASPAVIVGSPAAPTIPNALSASTTTTTGSLVVSFTAGADNGSAITGYTATCTSSNAGVTRTATGTTSPLTVTGATTGKTYTCTVEGTNSRGSGLPSAASVAVIVGAPAAPTAVKAASASTTTTTGSLVVSFTVGANNGSAVTGYTAMCISSNAGATRTATGTASPLTVTLATTAKTYTCTVKATNARGSSVSSAVSPAVIVGSPNAPTAVKAVSASTSTTTGSLVVSFTAGANNGSAVTGHTATCTSSNAGVTGTKTGTASPLTVTGVTTGKTYTCTVKATNARGSSVSSAVSPAVIVGSPNAPTGITVLRIASGQIRVSFTPGANNGSAVTSYTASCTSSSGGVTGTQTGAASPLTVISLTPARSYTCTVKATNARGAGLSSSASSAVDA